MSQKSSVAISTFHTVDYRVKRQQVKGKIDFFFPTFLEPPPPITLRTCRTLRKKRPIFDFRQKCLKRQGYRGDGSPNSRKDPTLYPRRGRTSNLRAVGLCSRTCGVLLVEKNLHPIGESWGAGFWLVSYPAEKTVLVSYENNFRGLWPSQNKCPDAV